MNEAEDDRVGAGGLILLGLFTLVAAAMVLGVNREASPISTLEAIEQGQVVRIGYANEAPYGYLDTRTGEVDGEAPRIAKEILQRMGVTRVEPVVAEFGSLIPGLKAGRFDLIAAGMYITPARCRQIAFSHPTYRIGEAFMVRRGNPLKLHSFEDVAASGTARLGVVGGAIEDQYARSVGIAESQLFRFPDNVSAVTGMLTGRIDAFAATELTVHDLLHKAASEQLERAEPFRNPRIDGQTVMGYGAFGFRTDDEAFRDRFDGHLRDFLGTEAHLRLVAPFGIGRENIPLEVDRDQLCAGLSSGAG